MVLEVVLVVLEAILVFLGVVLEVTHPRGPYSAVIEGPLKVH